MSDGAEQWCPVEGGGCISEVSLNRGFTVGDVQGYVLNLKNNFLPTHICTVCMYCICQNRSPGLQFLPEGLDLASIQARLLFIGTVNNNRKVATNRRLCIYEKGSVGREHHMYKAVWTSLVGEELQVKAENDQHAGFM